MNIKVLGNGFVANALPYLKIIDRFATNRGWIKAVMQDYGNPDVVVNCIGFTGRPTIDECEEEKEKTYETNTILPILLAQWCVDHGSQFINMSSGCIFAGPSPNQSRYLTDGIEWRDVGYRETDNPNPVSYYSKTKAACDMVIQDLPGTCILRIRMPISSENSPRNFISKIRNYKQLIDIPNSVTFMDDLVKVVKWCIDNHKTGIYNVINPQPLTAVQVIEEYKKHVPNHPYSIITGSELDKITAAKRSNCILDGSKLKNEGFVMTNSRVALEKCMAEYVKNMETNVK